jgi:hypothetical protein
MQLFDDGIPTLPALFVVILGPAVPGIVGTLGR